MSVIIDTVNRFRAEVLSADRVARLEMERRWLAVESALLPEVDALVMEILAGSGTITQWQLVRLRRYQSLLEQIDQQVTTYGATSATAVADRQRQMVDLAQSHAVGMAEAQGGAAIRGEFNRIPLRAVENMVGVAGNGSPLLSILQDAGQGAGDALGQELINGIALGLNPRVVADRALRRGLAQSYVRMLTIARTETMRVYRHATLESYRGSRVVMAYKRICAKSERTCIACLVADGTVYELATEFEEHVNGRCTCVPILRNSPAPTWLSGRQWFEAQAPEMQRRMLGAGAYNAWRGGAIDLADLVERHEHPVWGASLGVKSLRRALAETA